MTPIETGKFSLNIVLLLVLSCLVVLHLDRAFADEHIIDPKIGNGGPVIRLATSDLPKAHLVNLKDGQIDWERPGVRI